MLNLVGRAKLSYFDGLQYKAARGCVTFSHKLYVN
jgi:hypothetical protein